MRLTFRNVAPSDLPPYVAGPHPATDLTAAEYQGIVAVNAPRVGSQPHMEGLDTVLVAGRDGPTNAVAAGPLRLKPGESSQVVVRFVLPQQLGRLVVEPSARIPPISWTYRGETWTDTERHTVELP